MAEIIYDERRIVAGEPFFIVYVDRVGNGAQQILAALDTGLTGPATTEQIKQRKLTGFELPALELITKAREAAEEAGVRTILIVDPNGWLPHAKINRYVRG